MGHSCLIAFSLLGIYKTCHEKTVILWGSQMIFIKWKELWGVLHCLTVRWLQLKTSSISSLLLNIISMFYTLHWAEICRGVFIISASCLPHEKLWLYKACSDIHHLIYCPTLHKWQPWHSGIFLCSWMWGTLTEKCLMSKLLHPVT